MSYYKLIDAIQSPKTLSVVTRNGSSIKYGTLRLEPGKKYELPDDDVLLKAIKDATELVKYTPSLEEALNSSGTEYEKIKCSSCGGRVLKLRYHVVEVIDDGN